MPTGNLYYTYLLRRYMEGAGSLAEREELFALLEQEELAEEWEKVIQDFIEESPPAVDYDPQHWQPLISSIVRPRAVVRRMGWWKVAVAVCLMVVGWWFLVRGPKSGESEVGGPGTEVVNNDVKAPENNKARVTLSDGRTVSLDSLQNGLLADQSGVKLIKLSDGQIIYQSADSHSPSPLVGKGLGDEVNTLINPRGSRVINLTLSDGTRVWLNAGSSLRYPLSFATLASSAPSRLTREVEITGEAYFEVAHDATKPFIVKKGDLEVKVLGTHFNVNAYDDEADIRVTLLEGRVKVSRSPEASGPREIVLAPGQQAIATTGPRTSDFGLRTGSPDLDDVMAWRNNQFRFNSTPLSEILRQLERWYDVDVTLEGDGRQRFTGVISRDVSVSEVFHLLQQTGTLQIKIADRKISIK